MLVAAEGNIAMGKSKRGPRHRLLDNRRVRPSAFRSKLPVVFQVGGYERRILVVDRVSLIISVLVFVDIAKAATSTIHTQTNHTTPLPHPL